MHLHALHGRRIDGKLVTFSQALAIVRKRYKFHSRLPGFVTEARARWRKEAAWLRAEELK